ncbi:hypothetical protein ON010_g17541 [Phytophthora cinnamomi]|nr:hypothetical protein ON010_g17541 [Phytophthora cinnamomi]
MLLSCPAADIRNLREVFGAADPGTGAMRLIVPDRFYTSLRLAMQLLTMGFFTVGTVQTNRLGLSISIVGEKKESEKSKKSPPENRPTSIERGTFEVTEHIHVPGLRALRRLDNKAVYILVSRGSEAFDRVVRSDKLTIQQAEVACPRLLKDYQALMGGVDVHDQLRLQRRVLLSSKTSTPRRLSRDQGRSGLSIREFRTMNGVPATTKREGRGERVCKMPSLLKGTDGRRHGEYFSAISIVMDTTASNHVFRFVAHGVAQRDDVAHSAQKRRIRARMPATEPGSEGVEADSVPSREDSNEADKSNEESTAGGPTCQS